MKEIAEFSPNTEFYCLRDKAIKHISDRVVDAYRRAREIREQIKTPDAFNVYQARNREILLSSFGDIPYDNGLPLDARITGVIEEKELIIEKVVFQSLPKMYVTANLYIPRVREEKTPAVLMQCGHAVEGKAYDEFQRAARMIARAGLMVFVTDPVGQGERLAYIENEEPLIAGAVANHQQFGHQCFLTGAASVKYFVADAMRAIDYLQSRADVDGDRIGATGISGGGTMTSVIAAVDVRVKAAAPGCWACAGEDYFFVGTSPDSEQIWPGIIGNNFECHELMSVICPRPLLFLSAEDDFIPIEGVKKLYGKCTEFWGIAGNASDVQMMVSPGPHGYSNEMAVCAAAFFQKHLLGKEKEFSTELPAVLESGTLNVTKSGLVAVDSDSLFPYDKNLEEYHQTSFRTKTHEERRRILAEKVYQGRDTRMEIHMRTLKRKVCEGLTAKHLLWFSQELMPIYGVLIKQEMEEAENCPITICLWEGGTDAICEHETQIWQICATHQAVLIVDLTTMGKNASNELLSLNGAFKAVDKVSKTLIQLGDSLGALKTFDLMQSIRVCREMLAAGQISIYAEGEYAIFARMAELLDGTIQVTTENEVTVEQIITDKMYPFQRTSKLLMPGLGGLVK